MHINIPYSSGNFTSNTKQSMSFKNLAITDNNIFARSIQSPGILITSGFNHYCIITLIERTIFYQKITAHFEINTVIIMSMCFYIQITSGMQS